MNPRSQQKNRSSELTHNPLRGALRGFTPWGPDCLKCGEPIELERPFKDRAGKTIKFEGRTIALRSVRQGFVHEGPDCRSEISKESFDQHLQIAAENGEIPMHNPPAAEMYLESTEGEKKQYEESQAALYLNWHNGRVKIVQPNPPEEKPKTKAPKTAPKPKKVGGAR